VCGYIGHLSFENLNNNRLLESNKLIECRGPDELINIDGQFGKLFNNEDKLNYSYVFNRLSIIDLSDKASQPMVSQKFKSILMFNGEIFNHQELRNSLIKSGVEFSSDHSDTEVVLNGISYFGISFVEKLIGQFSFAFYSSNKKKLYLVRDRLGQKPLFYHKNKDNIIFGSNLKSVAKNLNSNEIDIKSLSNYLNYGVVPSPDTIYKNIKKVEPASIIEFDSNSSFKENNYNYWKIDSFSNENKFDSENFLDLMDKAIEIREDADVPIAYFLSGGIDSSSIVKNASDRGKELNTFSVGHTEEKYDESFWFNQVIKKYNTNAFITNLSTENIHDEIDESINIFDEPYSDPSTLPSHIISKEISKQYKVAISGDGGDELLGGYKRIENILNKNSKFSISKLINFYPAFLGTGNKILSTSQDLKTAYSSYFSDKKLIGLLNLDDSYDFEDKFFKNMENSYKSMVITDYLFYLSEMMMLKVDRTSMASSLEVRSPFVDHRLIEYIISCDSSYYVSNKPKKFLKDYLSQDFNKEFLDRSKMGFVFELEKWIYDNESLIKNTIMNNNLSNYVDLNKINQLFYFKTRINALRIWKIYFIEKFLNSLN